MWVLFLLPVLLSVLTLSAHFYRAGMDVLVFMSMALPLLLMYRKPVTVRIVQIYLVLAAAEWARTMLTFIQVYESNGTSWHRLALILGTVLVFTAGSALLFQTKTLKRRYRMQED